MRRERKKSFLLVLVQKKKVQFLLYNFYVNRQKTLSFYELARRKKERLTRRQLVIGNNTFTLKTRDIGYKTRFQVRK